MRLALLFLALAAIVTANDTKVALRSVELSSDQDANARNATSVDLVFVYARSGYAALPRRNADWFASKSALLAQLGDEIKVVSLEVPPAVAAKSVTLPRLSRQAVAVLVYVTHGALAAAAPLELSRLRDAVISIRATTVAATERKSPQRH